MADFNLFVVDSICVMITNNQISVFFFIWTTDMVVFMFSKKASRNFEEIRYRRL